MKTIHMDLKKKFKKSQMFRQFGEMFLLAWGVAFQVANTNVLWAGFLTSMIKPIPLRYLGGRTHGTCY